MLISHLFNLVLYMLNADYIIAFYFFFYTTPPSLVLARRRATSSHHLVRSPQLVVVLLSQLRHTALSVQFFADLLIRRHKLVNLSRQLVILVAHYPDVVVHAVDFDLQICIRLNKRRI